jgi:uncharacterized 2Fe-2S/4Fe-4S cluster protein (DUF4445 family)
MIKHTIRLYPLDRKIHVNDGTPLMDIMHEFGIEFPCGGTGSCGKCRIRLLSGNIITSEEHQRKLEKLRLPEDWKLACLSRCSEDILIEIDQFNHIILADESDFSFSPGSGYGVAVDLGTTTLVAQWIDLSNAAVMAVETMLNPQGKFGADLISRIQACIDGHQPEMERLIRSAVGNMIQSMIRIKPADLTRVVIVGNTVMQHIFSGNDVTPLSVYPFHTPNHGMEEFSSAGLDWNFNVGEKVRFYPSIGSFVGSDILAGIAATGMYSNEKFTALIDLGTNGEIAVGNMDGIVCASTAAGPAFEGANISMGMRAVTGAISSFNLNEDVIQANVIGNVKPRGICGSALIDAVAILRKQNAIGIFGEINSGADKIILSESISLTQKDIHEFLLAKAAIAAGLDILTRQLSISLSDIDAIYIAGGFGNYINLDHVVETGMILFPKEKIHKMGNTALIGAKMFLFSDVSDIALNILSKTTHINLESNPAFQEIYIENMVL